MPLWKRRTRQHIQCLDVSTTHLTATAFEAYSIRRGSIIAHCTPTAEDSGGNSVRPCRSVPGYGEKNDDSDASDLPEKPRDGRREPTAEY